MLLSSPACSHQGWCPTPFPWGWYNCPDMKYGGVPFMRRFFADSFHTEEAEVEVRQLNFLLILTPLSANFAEEILQGSTFSFLYNLQL